MAETQPELLAHHYTEAGLSEPAVAYWQRAGERANTRSAHQEAMHHLEHGLRVLETPPETSGRVERAFSRSYALCQQVGGSPQLFPVLWGLWRFYFYGGKLRTALELGNQCLSLAQTVQDSAMLIPSRLALGVMLFFMGDSTLARAHLEQSIALHAPQVHREPALDY